MEILDKLDDCRSTLNHLQLGPCLPFEYLLVFCHHVVVDPFWQIELFCHAEPFFHVFEVHSVFYHGKQKRFHHPMFWHFWGKQVKQQPVCHYVHPLMIMKEKLNKSGERSMAKGSLNISSSTSSGSSTATEWVVTVPSSLLFQWSGTTDILLLE